MKSAKDAGGYGSGGKCGRVWNIIFLCRSFICILNFGLAFAILLFLLCVSVPLQDEYPHFYSFYSSFVDYGLLLVFAFVCLLVWVTVAQSIRRENGFCLPRIYVLLQSSQSTSDFFFSFFCHWSNPVALCNAHSLARTCRHFVVSHRRASVGRHTNEECDIHTQSISNSWIVSIQMHRRRIIVHLFEVQSQLCCKKRICIIE